ncbi:MAG: Ig-like domain-containing protein, partial [Pseudomonadota bacterium]
ASEDASTFRDFRLDVTFTHTETGTELRVPGFFAADGDAAESGATSGNIWRAHFNPPLTGEWTYVASLRTGTDIAASTDPFAGTPVGGVNGQSGTFDVVETDKTGADFRAKGMLEYVDEHYLMHAGDGSYFIKAGADSPENFLAFADFDGTTPTHTYAPHLGDWVAGDPTWGNDQGKGIIGAVNYLASEGLNSIYFLTMNVEGDGKDVWPWVANDQPSVFDVSKLDQWEIVFQHMDANGLMLHVVTQEIENNNLLNGGDLGVERSIYYRELIARFGHHNGVTWNLGEENRNTGAQRQDFANYFESVDPYGHLTVVHTWPFEQDLVYPPLLGFDSFDGVSLQATDPRAELRSWIEQSEAAGRPWVVTWDETGPPNVGVPPDDAVDAEAAHTDLRNRLWQTLTAGGAGVEWYFGYVSDNGDLTTEDFRSRDSVWDWTVKATSFFANNDLPLTEMDPMDEATPQTDDFIFAKEGEVYVIYQPDGGPASLDLSGFHGTFLFSWYNPREPGGLIPGDTTSVEGGSVVALGSPPPGSDGDWTILVRRVDADVVAAIDGVEDQNLIPGQQAFLDQFAQVATGTALTDIIIQDLPDTGLLLLNGGPVQLGQTIPLDELGNLLYQPEADFNGVEELRWQPVDAGGPVDAEILAQLSLAPVNDDPVAVDDGVLVGITDQTLLISNTLLLINDQDIDGDLLTIVSVGDATNGQVSLQQAAVSFLPDPGFTGIATFSYTIEDPSGVQDTAQVTLSFAENTTTNHSLSANSGLAGTGVRDWGDGVTVQAFQANGSPGEVFFENGAIGVEGDRFDGQVGYQGDTQTSQALLLTFDGGATEIVFRVGRLNPAENSGEPETGRWTAFDAGGQQIGTGLIGPAQGTAHDQFTYSIPVNIGQLIFSLRIEATGYGHGALPTTTPDNSDFNLLQLDFVKQGATANQAPIVIGNLADAVVDEEAAFVYATSGVFFDQEDDALTYSAVLNGGDPLPAWLSVNAQTGQITGTPDDGDVGTIDLTITASDASGQASTGLNITVNPINDQPVAFDQNLSASPDHDVDAIIGHVAANDPDIGDVLNFEITGGNAQGIFGIDPLTGDITVAQPDLVQIGTTYNLTVEVSDDADPSLSDTATIQITGAELPGSFALSIGGPASTSEDGSPIPIATITRTGDISQAALVDYTITGDVDGADLQGMLNGTISFAPGQAQQVLPVSVFADQRAELDEDLIISVSGHPIPPTPGGAFDWSTVFQGQQPNGLARKYDLPTLAADALVFDLSQSSQFQYELDPDQDAVFIGGAAEDMPHRFKVVGGRDIVLLGGTFVSSTSTSSTLRFDDVYGSVFIDGVHIDNAATFGQDGIVVGGADGTTPDVTIQNTLVDNISGSIADGEHGDVFQPQGPLGHLKVFNLTGSSNYQGFFLQEQPDRSGAELESATLENVNLRHTPGDHFTSILLWLGEPYPTTLKNVFVTQKDGQQAEDRSVYPFSTTPDGAVRSDDTITWPDLPITGEVEVGTPPGGDFVKPEDVGEIYVPDLSGLIGTITGDQQTITIQDDDDADDDGFGIGDGDLDDDDPTVFPGAPELVDDGKDNDGDGEIDEHLGGPSPLAGINDQGANVGSDLDFTLPAPLFSDPDEPFGDVLSLQAKRIVVGLLC